jgi:hypothetical protein
MEPEQPSIAITATGYPVQFSREERERHVYVVGKSGSGKSTLVFNLAMLDIVAGEGWPSLIRMATWRKWSRIVCHPLGHTKLATLM